MVLPASRQASATVPLLQTPQARVARTLWLYRSREVQVAPTFLLYPCSQATRQRQSIRVTAQQRIASVPSADTASSRAQSGSQSTVNDA